MHLLQYMHCMQTLGSLMVTLVYIHCIIMYDLSTFRWRMRVSVPAVHVPSEPWLGYFQSIFFRMFFASMWCQTTFAKRAIAHCLEWSAPVSTAHVLRTVAATIWCRSSSRFSRDTSSACEVCSSLSSCAMLHCQVVKSETSFTSFLESFQTKRALDGFSI